MLRARFYGRSDVGRKRLSNEDCFHTSDEDSLGLVCDGMGGHEGGEIASRLAVDVISEGITLGNPEVLRNPKVKISQRRAYARELVLEWTQKANGEIFHKGGEDTPLRTRMGTTLALVFLVQDFMVLAHVGDSRIYRIRDDKIELMTVDHSILGPSRAPRQWGTAPKTRKFVTKALGTKSTVEPDIRLEDAAPGDVYILCSDGLSDAVKEPEIAEIVRKAGKDRRMALRSLIHLANKRGGRDNITVVLAELVPDAVPGESDDDDGDTDLLDLPKPKEKRGNVAASGKRGAELKASGERVKASGERALKTSGDRLKASGERALKTSGERGLKTSGERALKTSGDRLKASGERPLKASGERSKPTNHRETVDDDA